MTTNKTLAHSDAAHADDLVTCDECDAVSESGWGDAPTCLECTPSADVCPVHARTLAGTCPLCDDES